MFAKQDLRKLIIPLLIEQILAVTIGMADTMMVAVEGEAAVSGISLVDSINILLIQVFAALSTGGAVVASQYIGRRDPENACIAAKQLYLSVTVISLLLMTVAIAFRYPILRLIFGDVEYDVMENSKTYFLYTAISYPFLACYNSGASLFRSMGNSKVSMITSVIMNVINVTGNAVLILVFHLGVLGAAISTLAARIVGSVIITILISHPENPIHINEMHKIKPRPDMIKRILSVGVPTGLENSMFQIGKLLVRRLISSFGTIAIAANAVADNIANFCVIPGAAISLALVTVVGQCAGAGEYDMAKQYSQQLIKKTVISLFFLNVLVLILLNPIIGLYNLSPETAQLTKWLIFLHGTFCIFLWPLSFTLPNVLRASGDARFTMTISIMSMWIFRIGCSYLFALTFNLGMLGVWIAMFVDWIFRAACFVIRFHTGGWTKKKVI